jgi:hypothetical protein
MRLRQLDNFGKMTQQAMASRVDHQVLAIDLQSRASIYLPLIFNELRIELDLYTRGPPLGNTSEDTNI